jgi:tetratricopeptide (TPR) repeat protein
MKSLYATYCVFGAVISAAGLAPQAASPAADPIVSSSLEAIQGDTPAQLHIAAAKQQLKLDPKKVQAYNELSIAFLARARETADPTYLKEADSSLAQGLSLDPANFQLERTRVALMLGRHQFAQAKEKAAALNHRTPDDVLTYGYLAEADSALGNYPEAETNAQWMLNLRPNNIPGLLIGARLRVLYGDAHGAIDFLNLAYSETSPSEVEELAWIANQIASIEIESGQIDAAVQTLDRAEQLFPRYPRTMENVARVRMGQKRENDALRLWKQAAAIDRDPHILYELARAQEAAGQTKDAGATYTEFEKRACDLGTTTDTSRLDLILMYAGSPATAVSALNLAQQEMVARQDVYALDAYAWALYANGKHQEADVAIQRAIAVGIQSAQIFDHAGHIAQALNNPADAGRYFVLALQSNPSSEYASDARKFLGTATVASDKDSMALPVPTAVVALPADVLRGVVNNSNSLDHTAESLGLGMTSVTSAFGLVPDTLLIPRPTGTEQLIHAAQVAVARGPNDAKAYEGLGAAYFQRARETGDVSDYQLAERSIARSLDIVSTDFSAGAALGTMAEVCMGEHRFADALTYAQKALSLGTGDLSPFAIIGDAYADIGEYDKAGTAYARLTPPEMTLSPRAAYARDSRISYLKFIAGDTAGAISLMKTAVTEGVEAQLPSENLAWLYYEFGEYFTQLGDSASADLAYVAALNTHPGDYRALAALGKLRANRGRYAEAIVLYRKAVAVVPMPIFIAELGDLYAKTGNQVDAQEQFALVEYIGLLGHINQVLHNRDLALFYADHDLKLTEALELAQKELEVRHDVYTWDTLAWALYKNGKPTEAAKASKRAMQFGTHDSLLLFHAGMIAEALGQQEEARNELKQALQINPHFHLIYASQAQQRLAALEMQLAAKEGLNNHAL